MGISECHMEGKRVRCKADVILVWFLEYPPESDMIRNTDPVGRQSFPTMWQNPKAESLARRGGEHHCVRSPESRRELWATSRCSGLVKTHKYLLTIYSSPGHNCKVASPSAVSSVSP